jgi:hypothetical protein
MPLLHLEEDACSRRDLSPMRYRETSIQRRAEGFRLLHDELSAFQYFSRQQAPGGMRDFHLAAALELGDALY